MSNFPRPAKQPPLDEDENILELMTTPCNIHTCVNSLDNDSQRAHEKPKTLFNFILKNYGWRLYVCHDDHIKNIITGNYRFCCVTFQDIFLTIIKTKNHIITFSFSTTIKKFHQAAPLEHKLYIMLWYRCLHKQPCGSKRGRGVSKCVFAHVYALGRCVLREVTVFSLHIFTHNHITPTLKTDTCMCNTQTHNVTLFPSLSLFHSWIMQSLQISLPKCTVLNNPILCVFVWVCPRTYSCTCVYASCCWIGIVFPCASDRAIWKRAQGGEANADLMSRWACRIEKCIGTVMWGDVPISPSGIRVLSCTRWGDPSKATSFHLFPPPTLHFSLQKNKNNSPSGCMGSCLQLHTPALGVIDFFRAPCCGAGNGGKGF